MKVSNQQRREEKLEKILKFISESFYNYECLAMFYLENRNLVETDFEIQERKALALLKHNFNMLKDFKFQPNHLFDGFPNKEKLDKLYQSYVDYRFSNLYGAKFWSTK